MTKSWFTSVDSLISLNISSQIENINLHLNITFRQTICLYSQQSKQKSRKSLFSRSEKASSKYQKQKSYCFPSKRQLNPYNYPHYFYQVEDECKSTLCFSNPRAKAIRNERTIKLIILNININIWNIWKNFCCILFEKNNIKYYWFFIRWWILLFSKNYWNTRELT